MSRAKIVEAIIRETLAEEGYRSDDINRQWYTDAIFDWAQTVLAGQQTTTRQIPINCLTPEMRQLMKRTKELAPVAVAQIPGARASVVVTYFSCNIHRWEKGNTSDGPALGCLIHLVMEAEFAVYGGDGRCLCSGPMINNPQTSVPNERPFEPFAEGTWVFPDGSEAPSKGTNPSMRIETARDIFSALPENESGNITYNEFAKYCAEQWEQHSVRSGSSIDNP